MPTTLGASVAFDLSDSCRQERTHATNNNRAVVAPTCAVPCVCLHKLSICHDDGIGWSSPAGLVADFAFCLLKTMKDFLGRGLSVNGCDMRSDSRFEMFVRLVSHVGLPFLSVSAERSASGAREPRRLHAVVGRFFALILRQALADITPRNLQPPGSP